MHFNDLTTDQLNWIEIKLSEYYSRHKDFCRIANLDEDDIKQEFYLNLPNILSKYDKSQSDLFLYLYMNLRAYLERYIEKSLRRKLPELKVLQLFSENPEFLC